MPARNQSRIGIASTRKDDLTQNRELQNENDIARTYNKLKQFDGKKYTGMKVGGSHRWYYDKGEWKEKKVSPDKWRLVMRPQSGGLDMPQKVLVFLLVQSIIGTFLLIRVSENWMQTTILHQ